jgi:hypothetical protein
MQAKYAFLSASQGKCMRLSANQRQLKANQGESRQLHAKSEK